MGHKSAVVASSVLGQPFRRCVATSPPQSWALTSIEKRMNIEEITRNPKFRLIVSSLLTIAVGVLCSLFASEISKSGVVEWSSFHKTRSFWLLLVVVVVWIWAQVFYLKHDERVHAFSDDAFCLAHIRKTKLEAFARLVKTDPEKANLVKASTLLEDLGVKQ
ncbi:hypothetical protein OOT55_16380 [Marinimicrobium sp. C6131]|uniref:hypothetical protein n=1 Tax=Marinimicrobium sp. C6131 TaxID=3022676 RepID=UPI00223CF999|nr:hypothetical protein [Marinimicrobium sp. C6131]UZJ44218.1 hypothetical protein OOT55_16380 [Marinimicrobium sp. C6131]